MKVNSLSGSTCVYISLLYETNILQLSLSVHLKFSDCDFVAETSKNSIKLMILSDNTATALRGKNVTG